MPNIVHKLLSYPGFVGSVEHYKPKADVCLRLTVTKDGCLEIGGVAFKTISEIVRSVSAGGVALPSSTSTVDVATWPVSTNFLHLPTGERLKHCIHKSWFGLGESPRRTKPQRDICPGIECSVIWPLSPEHLLKDKFKSLNIFHDTAISVFRSRRCCKAKLNIKPLCNLCSRLLKRLQQLISKFCCGGVDQQPFRNLFAAKEWLGSRAAFIESSILINDRTNKAYSFRCQIFRSQIRSSRRCAKCNKLRKFLLKERRRLADRHADSRVFTPTKFLGSSWHKWKGKHIRSLLANLRRKAKATRTARPTGKTNPLIEASVKAFRQGLTRCVEMVQNPVCRWDGCAKAMQPFRNISLLISHVKRAHITPLIADNKDTKAREKSYACRWHGCSREKPFKKVQKFTTHIIDVHTGRAELPSQVDMVINQVKMWARDRHGYRYSNAMKSRTLKFYNSRRQHERMRHFSVLPVPSLSTVLRLKNINGYASGFTDANIDAMKRAFEQAGLPEIAKLGMLAFDEVYIREGIVLDPARLRYVGFTNQRQPKTGEFVPAKCILQFFFVSLFSDFKFPIAHYATRGLTVDELGMYVVHEGIPALHRKGFNIHAIVCDNLATNRSFIETYADKHPRITPAPPFPKCGFNHCTRSYVVCLSDYIQILKNLRNMLYASRPGGPRLLKINGCEVLWKHITAVYDRDQKRPRRHTRLTKHHIRLDSWLKMKPSLVQDTFSDAVIEEMEKFGGPEVEETVSFLRACRMLWRMLNSNDSVRSLADSRIAQLKGIRDYFAEWEAQAAGRPKQFISPNTWYAIQTTISGTIKLLEIFLSVRFQAIYPGSFIVLRKLSQNCVEAFFSGQRAAAGGGQHMTVYNYCYTMNTAIANLVHKVPLTDSSLAPLAKRAKNK